MSKATQTSTKKAAALPVTMAKTDIALAPQGAWGSENVSSKDLIIPKILVMQGLSEAVSEGKAAIGDMIDSVSGEKIGNKANAVPFIPFYTFKTWIESVKKGDKYEYIRQIPMDATNEDLPVEYQVDGAMYRRDRCINCYVLLPTTLDSNGGVIPYLISFRRTSYTAGKKLSTFIAKLSDANQPAAAKNFALSVETKKNDKGTYMAFNVEPLEATKPEHLKVAYDWYLKVKNTSVKVDDSDLRSEKVAAKAEASEDVEY
jgi:hypothetical protein